HGKKPRGFLCSAAWLSSFLATYVPLCFPSAEKHRHTIVPLISILVYSPGIIGIQYPTSISPIMVTGSRAILSSSRSGLRLNTALELHLARLPLPIILQVSFFQIYASTSCLSSSTTCSTMILGHR